MAGVRTVKVRFDGDTKGLVRASREAGAAMGKWGVKTQALGTSIGIGMAAAARALFRFGKDSIAAFSEAEQSQTKLQDAFARFPKLADTNIEKLRALNTELMNKTRFDDDAFASGQAVLAQFKLSGKQIESLTPLLADYAAKTGKSLPEAAETLGKSFLGNTRALKALGISYKSTGNLATDTKNITRLVREQVGGFAEKEGKTAAGQAAILGNRFGELKEGIGAKLLPVLMSLASWGLKIVAWIEQNKAVMHPLLAVIAAVVAIQWAWNIAMAANPIGLIVIGIAALIAIIVLVATKTRFFQNVWGAAWGGIKAAALAVGRWFRDTLWGKWILGSWNAILQKGKDVAAWFRRLPGTFKTLFLKISDFITAPFRAAFNFVARAWNNTIGSLSWTVPGWIPGIGGNSISAPRLPTFHRGGIVGGTAEQIVMARAGEGVFTPEQMRALGGRGNVDVRVFIGETELRGMVRTEIREDNRALKRGVLAGAGAR